MRTERKGNPESRRQHWLSCHFQFFQLCLLQPFSFGSSVLKPDFNLSLRQVERAGKLCALSDGEVLLLAKLPLQGQELRRGEGGPGLPVRFVLSQGAGRRTQSSYEQTKIVL